jgi:hypothetical protein
MLDCSRALEEVGYTLPGLDVQLVQRGHVAFHAGGPVPPAGERLESMAAMMSRYNARHSSGGQSS